LGTFIPLGTIRGIKVRLHWSWLIIFVLIVWSLATSQFPSNYKSWSSAEYWVVAVAAALLLFVSVLIHELSHSVVAQAKGLPVDTITLYVFGGASNLPKEPQSAGTEFWMAFAGPLSSIVLGVLFLGAYLALPGPQWLGAIFAYLGTINLILAVFNLIPAFPLDGGRVLRSIMWAITRDRRKASGTALTVSQWIAWGLILLGIWTALTVSIVSGIWLALIGWIVQNTASAYRVMEGPSSLQSLRVADAMTVSPVSVGPDLRLDKAVQDYLLHQDERALPVVTEDQLRGLLTVSDIQKFPADTWQGISVWRAMTPVEKLVTVEPSTPLMEALRLMTDGQGGELPVVEAGELRGLLSRDKVQHYLRIRHELGIDASPPDGPDGRESAA
jgi:Zn-dependent protease